MVVEVELKLELSAADAERLEAAPLWQGRPTRKILLARYYDTPDQQLRRNGLSLRVRRRGKRHVQTVKAGGGAAAGLFARSEWEEDVADFTPRLHGDGPVLQLLGEEGAASLAPLFDVAVKRLTRCLSHDGAEVELALDRGAASVADREAPICEVELELRSGDPAALFALAREIDALAPVRLGVLTKSARGYALLEPVASAEKSVPVALERGMTAQQGFAAIARNCICHYRQNEALLLAAPEPDAEAVHQARVALRRLRSAFRLFRPMLDDPQSRRLAAELRWLAGRLGAVRDLDVMQAATPVGEADAKLIAARAAAHKAMAVALLERARWLMLDLAEWLTLGEWATDPMRAPLRELPAEVAAAAALDRMRRRVRKHGKGLKRQDDAQRHGLRKDSKKLRYAVEFFAGLFPSARQVKRHRHFLRRLERLQDHLGALNDRVTTQALAERLGIDAPVRTKGASRKTLLRRAGKAQAALMEEKRFWTTEAVR